MNALDAFVLLVTVSAGIGGYRLGFVARVVSWIGMLAGLYIASRILPTVVRSIEGADQVRLLFASAGVLIGGAFLGQALGLVVGSRLHLALPHGQIRSIDRGVGAGAGVVGVVVSMWLLLPTMSDIAGWPAQQARNSLAAELISDLLPSPPDPLQTLRRLVGEDQFPQVFSDDLAPAPALGPPPASSGLVQAVADRVAESTFKIEGVACRRIQEGSGFAVGPDLVVTNAHVVAGEDDTVVQRRDGVRIDAVVVAFDPERDLAVLRAPNLDRPGLATADGSVGDIGAVFGYPGGGPLEVSPFEVGREVTATGRDIYGRTRTSREVLFLSSELRPGDSGAALVDPAGTVIGVAFAIAPDRSSVAYALEVSELDAVLATVTGTPVDTGDCLV